MTIFEKMLNKEIPIDPVYEDENVLVIRDIAPQTPCHVLIIPKHHATCLNDVESWTDEQAGQFLKTAITVAKKLGVEEEGYRIIINTKDGGGQTVDYLHMHLLAGTKLGWRPA